MTYPPTIAELDAAIERLQKLNAEYVDLIAVQAKKLEPLSERQIMQALGYSRCYGKVKMSYEHGPYGIESPTLMTINFVRAIERIKESEATA